MRKETTALAFNKKRNYYAKKIDKCDGNSKALFGCINELLDTKQNKVLPSHNSSNELADRFQTFFKEKISSIREAIPTIEETCVTSFKGDTVLDN